MLMDEAQVALNEVMMLSTKAVDRYGFVLELTEDEKINALAAELQAMHERLASRLKQQIQDLGALPREHDPEQEGIEQALSQAEFLREVDERRPLLDECIRGERDLAKAIEAALEENLPEAARDFMQDFAAEIKQAKEQLTDLRARI